MNRKDVWFLTILVLLVIGTRFVFATTVPANLQSDAVDTIRIFMEHAHKNDWSFLATNWNGAHIINQWLVALPWYLLGKPYWAVTLFASVLSILCVVAFYGLVVQATQRRMIAFMCALWLMVDPWFLNFSRSGWENIANCLAVIGLLSALLLPTGKLRLQLAILMLVACIAPYLYHPGKIVAAIATVAIVVVILRASQLSWKQRVLTLLASGIGITLMLLPLVMTSASAQIGRIATVSVFIEPDPIYHLVMNLQRNIWGFTTFQAKEWHIGINSRYIPLSGWVLSPVIVVLYWLGVVVSIRRRWWLLLVGFFLIYPINILSKHTPDAARTVHALPYIYLVVSYAILAVNQLLRRLSHRYHLTGLRVYPLAKVFGQGLIIILVMSVAVIQFLRYWTWITHPITLSGREPAIYRHEYDRWLSDLDEQLNTLGRTISIYEWKGEN